MAASVVSGMVTKRVPLNSAASRTLANVRQRRATKVAPRAPSCVRSESVTGASMSSHVLDAARSRVGFPNPLHNPANHPIARTGRNATRPAPT